MSKTKNTVTTPEAPATWERPELKYVGHVGEIFLFPGGGKVSTANYDTGDSPFKPKGKE